MTPIEV